MPAFRFIPDREGIKAVSEGEGIAAVLDATAGAAADRMRTLSANMSRSSYFAFRASITTRRAARGPGGTFVAYVGSDSPGWHLQEYGTAHSPPRAVIRRGLRAVPGLRFEEH